MEERKELLEEWKKHDPLLEDMDGFDEFVEDRLHATEVTEVENGKEIEKAFRVMKKITEKGNLRIDENGIFLREINKTHTSMAELSIPPEALKRPRGRSPEELWSVFGWFE